MQTTQTEEKWLAFSERVSWQGHPHLIVEPFAATPDDVARLNERNLHVLRTLASLDERRVESTVDVDDPVMQELQRMDSKLNVLLDIVDRLLLPATLLPPRQPVSFNAVGLIVPAGVLPSDGPLLARMHFEACRALPLELPVQQGKAVGNDNVFLYFRDLSEPVEDGLERFVFCHHRRKVAEARLSGMPETVPGHKHRM